jgi:hypothetical protein
LGTRQPNQSSGPIEPCLIEGFTLRASGSVFLSWRREHIVGVYRRLLREAAELPENLKRDRNNRMSTYLGTLRRLIPEGGGYVTLEELGQERKRYLTDM